MKFPQLSRKRICLLFAILAIVVHGVWIQIVRMHVPDCGAPPYKYPYNMGDSGSYWLSSQALFDARPMAPLFRERIVFPLFLAAGIKLGDPTGTLFLMLPFHGIAVVAVCYLAGILSGDRRVPILGGLLYLANPALYGFGIALGPDVLHAQLALIAIALAVAWPGTRKRSHLVGAVLAWIVTQLTRPTFYPIAPGLALLWWPCLKDRATRRATMLAIAASLVVPIFFTASNAIRYGVATPYFAGYENIVKIIPARLRMFLRHREDPSQRYSTLYLEEETNAGNQPDYLALHLRAARPPAPDFARHYRDLLRENLDFIQSNFGLFARSGLDELLLTIAGCGSSPVRKLLPDDAGLAVAHESLIRKTTKLAVPLVVIGLAIAFASRRRRILAFAVFCLALLFIPSVMLWWQGLRTRLPAELLMTPFLALALGSWPGWGFIAGSTLLGYVPFKVFRLPEFFLKGTTWLCLALVVLAVVRRRDDGSAEHNGSE